MKAKDLLQGIKQADSRTELSTLVDVLDESLKATCEETHAFYLWALCVANL